MAKHGEAPKEQKTLDEAAVDPTPAAAAPAAQEGMAPGEVPLDEPAPQQQPLASVAEATQALAPMAPAPVQPKAPVSLGRFGVELRDLESLWRFAQLVFRSGLAPKGFKNPEAVAVAVQLGMEIGLPPMSAIQNIAVINGRPGVYGQITKGIVENSGLLEDYDEWFEHDGKRLEVFPVTPDDGTTAFVTSKRKGAAKALTTGFSVSQAKKADLWTKDGPWKQYPGRMLMWRARQFNLGDNFADKLKGVRTVEELLDEPIDTEVTQDSGPIAMPQRASEAASAEPQA